MYAEHHQNNCIVLTPATSLSIAFKKYMTTTKICSSQRLQVEL